MANAKADHTADGRFTHSVTSGMERTSSARPIPYPRVLHGKPDSKGHADMLTVTTATEEKAAIETERWKYSPADWAATILLIVGLLFGARPVQAQQLVNHTTLSSALAQPAQGTPANQTQLVSCTNVTVGFSLWVDLELMQINTVVSTSPCLVNLTRGFNGTKAAAHAAAAVVLYGTGGDIFFHDGPPTVVPMSTCTRPTQLAIPWVDIRSGITWVCQSGGTWTLTSPRPTVTGSSTQFSRAEPIETPHVWAALRSLVEAWRPGV